LGTKGRSGSSNESELALFLDMLMAERGAAAKTIEAYTGDLGEFLAFLAIKRKTARDASADTVRAYLAQLSRKGLAPTSRARKLSAMRQFFRFLLAEGIRADDPCSAIDSPKLGRPLPKLLSLAEVESLLETAAQGVEQSGEGGAKRRALRLYALLETLYATGLRVSDLMQPILFSKKLQSKIRENNSILTALGAAPINYREVNEQYLAAGKKLRPFVANTVVYLHRALQRGQEILFEGAQGTFLDIDHGTYPYVTSSNTTAGGACTGSGVPPHRMDRVLGVMKAYTTRVGEGALPTEDADLADLLHKMGREFGATTGRARRCGWFDAVATRYATMINGIDELAITNLDGLDAVDPIRVCVGYRLNGKRLDVPPCDAAQLENCEPIYEELRGWNQSTHTAKKLSQLPPRARSYVKRIAELTGARLSMISVGPARGQTLIV
jgi:integrase